MDSHQNLKKYLASNTLLIETDIETIISLFVPKQIKRNEVVEREGYICKHFYFVSSGCLRLYEIDKKGNEVTGYFALEDSIITALPSFIMQKPSKDFLIAHEASEILSISRVDLFATIEKYPEFATLYHKFIEFAFIHSQMRIYSFLGMEGMDKLKWVIEHEPKLLQRVSSKAVASYLGMTNSTLSKLRAKM